MNEPFAADSLLSGRESFKRFEGLPEELQTIIMTSDPKSLISAQKVSKRASNQTATQFIEQNIFNKPTTYELTTYLSTMSPSLFMVLDYGVSDLKFDGYLHVFQNDGTNCYKYLNLIKYRQIDGVAETVFGEDKDYSAPIHEVVKMTQHLIYKNFGFDILTMKWVIETRLKRFKYSPDRVKEYILKYLNIVDQQFQGGLLPYAYSYFYFNALMMGLHPEGLMLEDHEFNLHDPKDQSGAMIAQLVDKLYSQIYETLDK